MIGFVFVLLSALIYGIQPSILNLALQNGVPAAQATGCSFLVAVVLTLAMNLVTRTSMRVPLRQAGVLILVGMFCTGLTSVLLNSSYQYIPVGCATTLHFMYPTFVCLATVAFFKSRLSVLRGLAILFSLVGLACIGGGVGSSPKGILLAVTSGLVYSSYILILDKSAVRTLNVKVQMLYTSIGAALFNWCVFFVQGKPFQMDVKTGGTLAVVGLMTFFAGLLFIAGIRKIGGTSASFFSLLEPITSLIFSTLLYHYEITSLTVIGCGFSILAILFIAINDAREAKRLKASVQQPASPAVQAQ